jgi:hypothetical protein
MRVKKMSNKDAEDRQTTGDQRKRAKESGQKETTGTNGHIERSRGIKSRE